MQSGVPGCYRTLPFSHLPAWPQWVGGPCLRQQKPKPLCPRLLQLPGSSYYLLTSSLPLHLLQEALCDLAHLFPQRWWVITLLTQITLHGISCVLDSVCHGSTASWEQGWLWFLSVVLPTCPPRHVVGAQPLLKAEKSSLCSVWSLVLHSNTPSAKHFQVHKPARFNVQDCQTHSPPPSTACPEADSACRSYSPTGSPKRTSWAPAFLNPEPLGSPNPHALEAALGGTAPLPSSPRPGGAECKATSSSNRHCLHRVWAGLLEAVGAIRPAKPM